MNVTPQSNTRRIVSAGAVTLLWLLVAVGLYALQSVEYVPKDTKLQRYIVNPEEFNELDQFFDSDGQLLPEFVNRDDSINLPVLIDRLHAIQHIPTQQSLDSIDLPLDTPAAAELNEIFVEIAGANSPAQIRRIVREYVRFQANPAYQIINPDGELQDRYIARDRTLRGELLISALSGIYPPERVDDIYNRIVENYDPETRIGNVETIGIAPTLWVPKGSLEIANFDVGLRIPYPRIPISAENFDIDIYQIAFLFALIELAMALYFFRSDEKIVRPLVRVVSVFLIVWSFFGTEPFWAYILNFIFPEKNQLLQTQGTVMDFTAQHLELVVTSSLITVPLGLTIGILVTRKAFKEFLPLSTNIVNIGQTIPTLAIIALMIPVIGLGFEPALLALILYGLLPVVRNTIVGIEGVDPAIVDAARGMGLTETEILFQVELRIASRVIMAGIRTSVVINIGTATLGAFAGSGGLGVPISSGLSSFNNALVFLGAIPAAVLAILADYILGRLEFVITPKGLQIEA